MHRVCLLFESAVDYLEVVNFSKVRLGSSSDFEDLSFDSVYRNFCDVEQNELRDEIALATNDFTVCITKLNSTKDTSAKCIQFFVNQLQSVQSCRFGSSSVTAEGKIQNLTVADSKEPFALKYFVSMRRILEESQTCLQGLSNRDDVTLVHTFELMKSSCSESQFLRIIELPNIRHWSGENPDQTTMLREFQMTFLGLRENVNLKLSAHPVTSLLSKRSQFRRHSYLSLNIIGDGSRALVLSHILYCHGMIRSLQIDCHKLTENVNTFPAARKKESGIIGIELDKERSRNEELSLQLLQIQKLKRDLEENLEQTKSEQKITEERCQELIRSGETKKAEGELVGEQRAVLNVNSLMVSLKFANVTLEQTLEAKEKAINMLKECCFKRETMMKNHQKQAARDKHSLSKEIAVLKATNKQLQKENEQKEASIARYKDFKKEAVAADGEWRTKNKYQKQLIDELHETENALKIAQEENLTMTKQLEVYSLSNDQKDNLFQERNRKLQETIDEQKNELEHLKQSNDETMKDLKEERQKSLENLRNHQKEMQEQRSKFDEELKEVQQKVRDINENEKTCLINLHKKELSNLKSQLYQERVKAEDRLKKDIKLAENRLEARQKELEDTMLDLETSEMKRIEILTEKQELQNTIYALEKEKSELSSIHDDMSIQKKLIEAKEATIKKLWDQREVLHAKADAERKKLQDEIFRIQNEMKQIQKQSEDEKYEKFLEYRKLEAAHNSTTSSLERAQKELAELKGAKSELKELQKQKREDDRKYKFETEDLKEQCKELQETVQNNQSKRKEDVQKLEKRLRWTYEDKISKLENDKEEFQDEVKRLKIKVEEEKTSRKERTKELLDLRDEKLKEKKALIEKNHAAEVKLKQENESLQGRIDDLEHKMDRMRLERDRLKKSNERIRKEMTSKDELYQISQKQDLNDEAYNKLVQELAEKEEHYGLSIEKLENRIRELLADKESLKVEKEKFAADLDSCKHDVRIAKSESTRRRISEKNLEREISKVKSKLESAEKRSEVLEREKRDLEQQVEESDACGDKSSQLLEKLEKMRAKVKELRSKNNDLNDQIRDQEERLEELEGVETSSKATSIENQKLKELIEEAKMETLMKAEQVRLLKDTNSENSSVKNDLRDKNRLLTKELEEVKKKLREFDDDGGESKSFRWSRLNEQLKTVKQEKRKLFERNQRVTENQRIIEKDLMKLGLLKSTIPRKLSAEGSFEKILKRFRLVNPTKPQVQKPRKRKANTPHKDSRKSPAKRRKQTPYLSDDDSVKDSSSSSKKPARSFKKPSRKSNTPLQDSARKSSLKRRTQTKYLSDDESPKSSPKEPPRSSKKSARKRVSIKPKNDSPEPKRKNRKRAFSQINSESKSPDDSHEEKSDRQTSKKLKARRKQGGLKRPSNSHDDSGLSSMLQSSDEEEELDGKMELVPSTLKKKKKKRVKRLTRDK